MRARINYLFIILAANASILSSVAAEDARLMVQRTHSGEIEAVAYSGDGRVIATAGADGRLKIWTPDLKLLADMPKPFKGTLSSLRLNSTGTLVAAGNRLFDRTTGSWTELAGVVAFAPASNTFVLAAGKQLKFYETPGKPAREISTDCDSFSLFITLRNEIVGFCRDTSIRVWDIAGKAIANTGIGFSADAVTASGDGQLFFTAQKLRRSAFIFSEKKITELKAISRQGQVVAIGEVQGHVRSWAPDSEGGIVIGTEGWIFHLDRNLKEKKSVRAHFQPNNNYDLQVALDVNPVTGEVISGSHIGLKISTATLSEKAFLNTGIYFNEGLAFDREGTRLASGGQHEAIMWTTDSRVSIPLRADEAYGVQDVAFSPQGHLAVAWLSDHVNIWQPDGTLLSSKKVHRAGATEVSFDDQPERLRTIGGDRTKKMWDYALNLQSAEQFEDFSSAAVRTKKNELFHERLAALRKKKPKELARLEKEGILLSERDFEKGWWQIKDVALHPNHRVLAKFDKDMVVRLWAIDSAELLGSLVHIPGVGSAIVATDGRFEMQGDVDTQMHWVVGDQVLALSEFRQKYETRGLLKSLLSGEEKVAEPQKQKIAISKRLVGKVFQIKPNGDIVIYTKVSGSLRAGKKLKILNGANYVDATISNTLHTNVTAKAKGAVAVGNPVFE